MEGYNKSLRTRRSRQTAELKVSHVTTFVGVINPFFPPALPLLLQVSLKSSAGMRICPTPPSVRWFSPFLALPPPTLLSLFPSLLSAPVHTNMLWPLDPFARGIWGWTLPRFDGGTSGKGKGYSIGIPPEPCTEFLPSDKSRQQVSVKLEGWGEMRERGGALTQSGPRGREHSVRHRCHF